MYFLNSWTRTFSSESEMSYIKFMEIHKIYKRDNNLNTACCFVKDTV